MEKKEKIRIAFVKYAGLAIGGSELWLQKLAVNLPKNKYEVDYYYCDSAPFLGSNYKTKNTNQDRLNYMRVNNINLIKFNVDAIDDRLPNNKWIGTDFWKKFDSKKYDLVQTIKAGPKEYPFYLIDLPIFEIVALAVGVDRSKNIAWSFHSSDWQRKEWVKLGGSVEKSSTLPAPIDKPATNENLRKELNIPENAVIAGFHQRADDNIWSNIPLEAFSKLDNPNWHFIVKNGSNKYREQAEKLNLKNIHFLGEDGDNIQISKFLNTIDIFAHGRKDGETFGAVFAEAMMHGKPCLSHYSPIANAQKETMGNGGLFADNLDDYAEKLKKLFESKELRLSLGQNGKKIAEEKYSIQKCIDSLTEVYDYIINKGPKPRDEHYFELKKLKKNKITFKKIIRIIYDYPLVERFIDKVYSVPFFKKIFVNLVLYFKKLN